MNYYTPYQYLKISIANHFGLDKKLFEERIEWVDSNIDRLEQLISQAEEPAQYYAAVLALRDTQQGIPTGYMVGIDATSSGLQIMAVLTGCKVTAYNTGLIDPNKRADVYKTGYELLQQKMSLLGLECKHEKADMKKAIMTTFYGSKAKPKEIFGEESIELDLFNQSLSEIAPEPAKLKDFLIASWQPNVTEHSWVLPDNFHAIIRNFEKETKEINHKYLEEPIYVQFSVLKGKEKGLSLAANVVHSVDAFVVREMVARCNYNEEAVNNFLTLDYSTPYANLDRRKDKLVETLVNLYHKTKVPTFRILNYLDEHNVGFLPFGLVYKLKVAISQLKVPPFELLTIHDEFKCLANYVQQVRENYLMIMMELADSCLLESIVSDIYKRNIKIGKATDNLSVLMKNSNYGIT